MTSQPTAGASDTTQSSSLSRGQACITCRRKKMRCDGVRPYCGPCSLTRHPEHCEFTDRQGRTFTEVLEERLHLLRTRLNELEEQKKDAPVFLRNPYPQRLVHLRSVIGDEQHNSSPARLIEPFDFDREPALHPEISFDVHRHADLQISGPSISHEPEIQELLQVFLPHAQRLHFSLHVPSLVQDMARPQNDPLRPHVCLASSVALWALCIMGPEAEFDVYESHYLALALDSLPSAHSSAEGRSRIYAIQAEILLALYFFNDARVLEGRYHIAAAGSGVLACGLQCITSSREHSASTAHAGLLPAFGTGGLQNFLLDPPQNALELGERINIFWTVYSLDRCWSVALGFPPMITDHSTSGMIIKSPIPKPLDIYQNLSVNEILGSAELSVHEFLDGSADYRILAQSSSTHLAFAIAGALFENATSVAGRQSRSDAHSNEFLQEFDKLDEAIHKFNDTLRGNNSPGIGSAVHPSSIGNAAAIFSFNSSETGLYSSTERNSMKVLARSLGLAAVIQLHYPLPNHAESNARCRHAIREIVGMIRSDPTFSGQMDKADFFLGVVWLSAMRVLSSELVAISTSSTPPSHPQAGAESSREGSSGPVSSEANDSRRQLLGMLRAQEIGEDIETLLAALRVLVQTCPLIHSQLEALEALEDSSL